MVTLRHRDLSCLGFVMESLSRLRWKIRMIGLQFTVLVGTDQHLVVVMTCTLPTMPGQMLIPTQTLVTHTKHHKGTPTAQQTHHLSSQGSSSSLHQKLRFYTSSRTVLHCQVTLWSISSCIILYVIIEFCCSLFWYYCIWLAKIKYY